MLNASALNSNSINASAGKVILVGALSLLSASSFANSEKHKTVSGEQNIICSASSAVYKTLYGESALHVSANAVVECFANRNFSVDSNVTSSAVGNAVKQRNVASESSLLISESASPFKYVDAQLSDSIALNTIATSYKSASVYGNSLIIADATFSASTTRNTSAFTQFDLTTQSSVYRNKFIAGVDALSIIESANTYRVCSAYSESVASVTVTLKLPEILKAESNSSIGLSVDGGVFAQRQNGASTKISSALTSTAYVSRQVSGESAIDVGSNGGAVVARTVDVLSDLNLISSGNASRYTPVGSNDYLSTSAYGAYAVEVNFSLELGNNLLVVQVDNTTYVISADNTTHTVAQRSTEYVIASINN